MRVADSERSGARARQRRREARGGGRADGWQRGGGRERGLPAVSLLGGEGLGALVGLARALMAVEQGSPACP